MLVGNKSDLKHLRAVPTEEAKAFAGVYSIVLPFPDLWLNVGRSMRSGERLVFHRDVCAGRIERRVGLPDHPDWYVDLIVTSLEEIADGVLPRHLPHRLEQIA